MVDKIRLLKRVLYIAAAAPDGSFDFMRDVGSTR
jgi:hypothetical protein